MEEGQSVIGTHSSGFRTKGGLYTFLSVSDLCEIADSDNKREAISRNILFLS